MNKNEYTSSIVDKLSYYYNIERNYELNRTVFDLYANSNMKNTKYMGSKKIVVYAYENNSYIFLKYFDKVDVSTINNILSENANYLLNQTNVDDEHMSTHYTFVFVVENSENKDVEKFVKKYRKQKSYCFGLKGWSSIGMVLVFLDNNKIFYNGDAKKIYKAFKPTQK